MYIRSPLTNEPIRDFGTAPLACNTNNLPVPKTLDVVPGDKFTFEWYHATRGDDILPWYAKGPSKCSLPNTSHPANVFAQLLYTSHPLLVTGTLYTKPHCVCSRILTFCLSERTGPVWVKIYAEKGADVWATDLLRQGGGQHSVIIPNLAPGDYLLRGRKRF